ncbi:MAG: metallophosphoesterase [Bacillota bacterium]|nr:metallophosphoesterase [Bacillota bacterium]HHU43786.1 hypothetical protein [Clostridiales bacterium]
MNRQKRQAIKEYKRYNKRSHTALKVIGIIIAVIFAFIGVTSIVGTVGANANMLMVKETKPVQNNGLKPQKDDLGYWTFTKEKDKDFRILQLTDIHIGGGWLSIKTDRLALNAVKKLVEYTKPDLIVITGDMVYPVPIHTGSINNKRATQILGTLLDSFEIPWAVTFGNHDSEVYSLFELEEISEIYESFENCIYQRGPEDITGLSNYFVNIKNEDGTLNTSLTMIDSNSYIGKIYEFFAYDNIHDDQVEWYEQELKKISAYYELEEIVPSLAFFHIPVNEFGDAWQLYRENPQSDEIEYHFGQAGEPGEKVYAPVYRGKIFEKMVELNSTKAIFCGHDHLNDFGITYKGIRLNYGKSIDYVAYTGIDKSTWQRGGTIIEIKDNSDFEVSQIKLVDIE